MRRQEGQPIRTPKYTAQLEGLLGATNVDVVVSPNAEYYRGRLLEAIVICLAKANPQSGAGADSSFEAVFVVAGFLQRHTLQMMDVPRIFKFKKDLTSSVSREAAQAVLRAQLDDALQTSMHEAFGQAMSQAAVAAILREKVSDDPQLEGLLQASAQDDADPLAIIHGAALANKKEILGAVWAPVMTEYNRLLTDYYERRAISNGNAWLADLDVMIFGRDPDPAKPKDKGVPGLLKEGLLERPERVIDGLGTDRQSVRHVKWQDQIAGAGSSSYVEKKALVDQAYAVNQKPTPEAEGFGDLVDEIVQTYVAKFIRESGKRSGTPAEDDPSYPMIHAQLLKLSHEYILEECAVFWARMDSVGADMAYPFKANETNGRLYDCIRQLSNMMKTAQASVDGKAEGSASAETYPSPVTILLGRSDGKSMPMPKGELPAGKASTDASAGAAQAGGESVPAKGSGDAAPIAMGMQALTAILQSITTGDGTASHAQQQTALFGAQFFSIMAMDLPPAEKAKLLAPVLQAEQQVVQSEQRSLRPSSKEHQLSASGSAHTLMPPPNAANAAGDDHHNHAAGFQA